MLKYGGFAFDLLRALSSEIGFTYTVNELSTGVYGYRDPLSGHWSGLIGEVFSGRADVAVGPLTITPERSMVVDFTSSFFQVNKSSRFNSRWLRLNKRGFDPVLVLNP